MTGPLRKPESKRRGFYPPKILGDLRRKGNMSSSLIVEQRKTASGESPASVQRQGGDYFQTSEVIITCIGDFL
jgi:hypothetical protein